MAFKRIYNTSVAFGFDPRKMIYSIKGVPAFCRDFLALRRSQQGDSVAGKLRFGTPHLCLSDRFEQSGSARGHYFHQDLLVAQRINLNNPRRHVDVGSRIDGFIAHVASFRAIEVFDIRLPPGNVPNVNFKQADMMMPLKESLYGYCDSLSCLHAIEHFGLGRYGDVVNYDGHALGLNNLYLLLEKGGRLYLSAPIGPARIEFNAHRVFSIDYLLDCFFGRYSIDRFSFVDDHGNLHDNVQLQNSDIKNNFGCVYGCGIFELIKL